LKNSKLYEGDDEADCTITVDDQLLSEIIERKTDAIEALEKGLLKVEGNGELLKALKEQIAALQ
jgi:putative sterol carrier protein